MTIRPAIARMAGYTPGEQPQGGKFIKLNTNENPYPPSPKVGQAVQAALERGLQKYPDPLATAFRTRAAQILGVQPDWILCGNGSDDLLTILTRAYVGPGDWLRLPYPSYILYKTLAELQDASAEEIHFRDDWTLGDDFAAPHVSGMALATGETRVGDALPGASALPLTKPAAPRERLRLAYLPNPNSPSGTLISREKVWELAQKLPCPLVVDEAYVDFANENCLDLVRRSDRVIVTRSLSKSYALAGLRFGFLVAQPQVVEQLIKVKDSYNCDALSIAGATAAIDDQAWLVENRVKILATRERLVSSLRELGFTVVPSQANFVWCTHKTRPVKSLYESLKSSQVLVRYMNYAGWGDGLRISVGTDEQIAACSNLLKSFV